MFAILLAIMIVSVVLGAMAFIGDGVFGDWNDRVLKAAIGAFVVAGTPMSFFDGSESLAPFRECGAGPARYEC